MSNSRIGKIHRAYNILTNMLLSFNMLHLFFKKSNKLLMLENYWDLS